MSIPAIPIPDPTTNEPPRPKRWIPISLRMFLVILALLGVGSALWFGKAAMAT